MSKMNEKKVFYKRVLMTISGVFLCGVSVGFLKLAAFGVDPFQSLMAGLNALVPIPFGTLHVSVSFCLLLFGLIFDRHYLGLGTLINLFLLGYIVEFSSAFLYWLFPAPSLGVRMTAFVIGIILICFSSAFYFTADMGVSPYDCVALILVKKWHIGPFRYVRVCTDLVCVSIGCAAYLAAGGTLAEIPAIAGCGTILTALFMGSLIEFFKRTAAQPFLNGRKLAVSHS